MRSKITTVQKSQEISALLAVPESRIIAGGTTFSPEEKETLYLVDISALEGLDGIRKKGNRMEIGPLAPLSALAASGTVQAFAPALAASAASAAVPDIREKATLGGNLASARIGDAAVVLLAYGAKLTIRTDTDYREILIDRFWNADGDNDLNYDEWIMRISLQIPSGSVGEAFGKTGEWDLTRETAGAAAVRIRLNEDDTVADIRGGLRVGYRNIRRMFPLEKALKNKPVSEENLQKAVRAMLSVISGSGETLSPLLTDVLARAAGMAKERRIL